MKKGLLSLSKEAVERSRQAPYPANAPQRPASGFAVQPAPSSQAPEQPAPPVAHEPTAQPVLAQSPTRAYAQGFLREAMSSHAAMAQRARMAQEGPRTMLSPTPAAPRVQAEIEEAAPENIQDGLES